jgi:hypothetical protein
MTGFIVVIVTVVTTVVALWWKNEIEEDVDRS